MFHRAVLRPDTHSEAPFYETGLDQYTLKARKRKIHGRCCEGFRQSGRHACHFEGATVEVYEEQT